MAKPCIPSLHRFSKLITKNRDIAIYLIKNILMNPGGISDYYEKQTVSFRKLAGKYGGNRQSLCDELERVLMVVFSKYFPENKLDISCTHSNVNNTVNDGRYAIKLTVNIIYADIERSVFISPYITVDEKTNEIINLNFD